MWWPPSNLLLLYVCSVAPLKHHWIVLKFSALNPTVVVYEREITTFFAAADHSVTRLFIGAPHELWCIQGEPRFT